MVYVARRVAADILGTGRGGSARRDAARANRPIYSKGLLELRRAGLPDGGSIADIGCARGDFLALAHAAGYEVVGVDIEPRLAADARARGFEVMTGDLRDVQLGRVVDAVTMWDVIEHVEHPVALLDACRRVLRPGGLVLFHTGNARFQLPKAKLLQRLRPHAGPYLEPSQHLTHFDPHTAAAALQRAGLTPVTTFFAGTLHYRRWWKRLLMRVLNQAGTAPVRFGGPLLTNAMGVIGRATAVD